MVISYVIITLILSSAILFFTGSLYQHSYYSLIRLYYRLIDQAKIYFPLFFVFLLSVVLSLILAYIYPILLLLTLVIPIMYLLFTPKIMPKLTNRFIRLFITANIVETSLILTFYFLFPNLVTYISFFSISSPLCFFLTVLGLHPYEIFRRRYCYHRAKEEIAKNPNLKIVGITGSYGKTTIKYFIKELLNFTPLLASKGNINTPLGIANFIRNELTTVDNCLILELGIDEINGMNKFKKFLSLDYAVITGITYQHIRTFKNIDNIRLAKMQIATLLKPGGSLIYNGDDITSSKIRSDITYLSCSRKDYKIIKHNAGNLLIGPDNLVLKVPFSDENQIYNAYLAYRVSELLSSSSLIRINISGLKIPERRKKIYKKRELTIIDDSYNLNIKGLRESIGLLIKSERPHYIITGGIKETGGYYPLLYEYFRLIDNADSIFFVGPLLPREKKIISLIPGLESKIVRIKKPILPLSGTLLLLTTGDKSSLK